MKTKHVAFTRQLFSTVSSSWSPLSLGLLSGYTAQALPSLQLPSSSLHLTSRQLSWITCVPPIVAVVSTPLAGVLANLIGRRRTMMLTTLPMMVGWLLVAFSQSFTTIIVGRGLSGAMTAIGIPCAYTYVAEISDSRHRGLLSSFHGIAFHLGLLLSYSAGSLLRWDQLALASAAVPCLQLILLSFSRPSPRWLVARGRDDEAMASLVYLRGGEEKQAEAELRDCRNQTREEGQGTLLHKLRVMTSPGGRRAVAMCLGLMLFVQTTGFGIVNFHAKSILLMAKITMDPNLATVMIGAVQLVGNIVSAGLVDRVGRKRLLTISGAMIVVSMFLLATYFHYRDSEFLQAARWTPVLFLSTFVFFFPLGWGSIPYVLLAELVPTSIRTETAVLCMMWEQLLSFIILQVHSTFCQYGPEYVHWSFSLSSLLSFVFIYLLPNTTRESLEDIEGFFSNLRHQARNIVERKFSRERKISVYDIMGGQEGGSRKSSHDRVVSLVDGDGGGDKDKERDQQGSDYGEERRVRFSPIVENLQERRRSVTKGRS